MFVFERKKRTVQMCIKCSMFMGHAYSLFPLDLQDLCKYTSGHHSRNFLNMLLNIQSHFHFVSADRPD